jgi:hypothetical protein
LGEDSSLTAGRSEFEVTAEVGVPTTYEIESYHLSCSTATPITVTPSYETTLAAPIIIRAEWDNPDPYTPPKHLLVEWSHPTPNKVHHYFVNTRHHDSDSHPLPAYYVTAPYSQARLPVIVTKPQPVLWWSIYVRACDDHDCGPYAFERRFWGIPPPA